MNNKRLEEIPIVFYRNSLGDEPVRDWLRSLPVEDRRKIGVDLAFCKLVGRSVCRYAGLLVVDYGKYVAVYRATVSHDSCFA